MLLTLLALAGGCERAPSVDAADPAPAAIVAGEVTPVESAGNDAAAPQLASAGNGESFPFDSAAADASSAEFAGAAESGQHGVRKQLPAIAAAGRPADATYRDIEWDELLPEGYDPDAVIEKYVALLDGLDPYDERTFEILERFQNELGEGAINESLNRQQVRLPGFVAPLEFSDGQVGDFLLVPYFGACIHVPPPPINQTVMVENRDREGFRIEGIDEPVWVSGEIVTEGELTEIGQAGYRIVNARIERFTGDAF